MPTPADSPDRRPYAVPDGGDSLTVAMSRAEWTRIRRGLEGAAYFAEDHGNDDHAAAYRALRDRILVAEADAGDSSAERYCIARFLADVLPSEYPHAGGDTTRAVTALYEHTDDDAAFRTGYAAVTRALETAGYRSHIVAGIVSRIENGRHLAHLDGGP